MYKKAIVLVSSLLVMGCASAGSNDKLKLDITDPSMEQIQPLSSVQIKKLLVGYTYPLSNGEIYFSSPVKATLIRDGIIEKTSWRATDLSSFCYMAKGKEICLEVRKSGDGNYVQSYQGIKKIITSNKIVKGRVFYNYYR